MKNVNLNKAEWLNLINQTGKQYRLESFCFTHDIGVNIYFDSIDELKQMTSGLEYEFWALEDCQNEWEISVECINDLSAVFDFIDSHDFDEDLLQCFDKIVKSGHAGWCYVKNWYDDNYFCNYKDNYDLGFEIYELSYEKPNSLISMYFDFEMFGKDCLMSDYVLINDKVYRNC